MTRIAAIVQARMGSTRFPGKSLADIAGRPMIARVVGRAAAIAGVDTVIVAITTDPADDALAAAAARVATVFRGHPTDVLDRMHRALDACGAEIGVRVTADCPLLDPAVSAKVVAVLRSGVAYASNVHPPTFPDGLDTEAFTRAALDEAWHGATLPSDREHVTPFLWRQPERFAAANVAHDRDLSTLRWTVDERDDLPFVEAVCRELDARTGLFGLADVLALLEARPDIATLAARHARNEGYAASVRKDHAV